MSAIKVNRTNITITIEDNDLTLDMGSDGTHRGKIDDNRVNRATFLDFGRAAELVGPGRLWWSNGEEWLKPSEAETTFKGSYNLNNSIIHVNGNDLQIDMGHSQRPDAYGEISDNQAAVYFPDDRSYTAELVEPGRLRWQENDTKWYKMHKTQASDFAGTWEIANNSNAELVQSVLKEREELRKAILDEGTSPFKRKEAAESIEQLQDFTDICSILRQVVLKNTDPDMHKVAVETLLQIHGRFDETREEILRIYKEAADQLLKAPPSAEVGSALLLVSDSLDEKWEDNGDGDREHILLFVISTLASADDWEMRQHAARWLGNKMSEISEPSLNNVLEALKKSILEEDDVDVREQVQEALKVWLEEAADTDRLIKDGPTLEVGTALLAAPDLLEKKWEALDKPEKNRIFSAVMKFVKSTFDKPWSDEIVDAVERLLSKSEALDMLIAADSYPHEIVGNLLLNNLYDSLKQAWKTANKDNRDKIISFILAALKSDEDWAVRQKAAEWIGERVSEIPEKSLERIRESLQERLGTEEDLDVIEQVQKSLSEVVTHKARDRKQYKARLHSANETDQRDAITELLKKGEQWALELIVQEWVQWIAYSDRSKGLLIAETAEQMRPNPLAVLPLINQLGHKFLPDYDELIETITRNTQRPTEASKSDSKAQTPQAERGKAKDNSESAGEAGSSITSGNTQRPTQASRSGSRAHTPQAKPEQSEKKVESTDKDSSSAQKSLPDSGALRDEIPLAVIDEKMELLVKDELRRHHLDPYNKIMTNLSDWHLARILITEQDFKDQELTREKIRSIIEDEFKDRELKVHRRIAKQLADMSNPNFFEEGEADVNYKSVKDSLAKYAIPALVPRLPEEADPNIRKDLAQVLGNLGGREAVDALARAVVGEERTRAAREKLLANYYLDPSKKRSEQAESILNQAVSEAKETLRLLKRLNVAVFAVGLTLLTTGLLASMVSEDAATRVVGALASLGGFLGVIMQLIRDPLNRIQTAMANLVQIEAAFTSFIWELNLNGTYIQSRYVTEGVLTGEEVGQTIDRIEKAMDLAMNLVAVYTDASRLTPYLTRLSPTVGKPGQKVTVFGQQLKNGSNWRKEDDGRIAINHVPIKVEKSSWESGKVSFTLPKNLPNPLPGGAIWISLIVNGVETNAFPFQVVMFDDK